MLAAQTTLGSIYEKRALDYRSHDAADENATALPYQRLIPVSPLPLEARHLFPNTANDAIRPRAPMEQQHHGWVHVRNAAKQGGKVNRPLGRACRRGAFLPPPSGFLWYRGVAEGLHDILELFHLYLGFRTAQASQ